MAFSTQRALVDSASGPLSMLDVSIKYQSRKDISVFFNDLPAPAGSWAWVGTTQKTISFTPPIPVQSPPIEVLIRRSTTVDKIINVFSKGAAFTNTSMDINFEQLLYLNQEAVEGAALTDIFNDVDFHGYRLTNLGDATGDLDAMNRRSVVAVTANALADAQAAAAASAASAVESASYRGQSQDYSEVSNTWAVNAQDWATKLGSTVDGTDYSAKYWAQQAAAIATGYVPWTGPTGGILVSSGTTAERPTPGTGQHPIRYSTTLKQFEGYADGVWGTIGGGATGGGTNRVFYLNDQTVTTNYTVPSGQNAGTFGEVTIANGVEVVVSDGSEWSIV